MHNESMDWSTVVTALAVMSIITFSSCTERVSHRGAVAYLRPAEIVRDLTYTPRSRGAIPDWRGPTSSSS